MKKKLLLLMIIISAIISVSPAADTDYYDYYSSRLYSNYDIKEADTESTLHKPLKNPLRLKFIVKKDKTNGTYKFRQSSNENTLDKTINETLLKSKPFDPLPSKFEGSQVEVQFPFKMHNQKNQNKSPEIFKQQRLKLIQSGQIINKRMRFSAGENGEIKVQELD